MRASSGLADETSGPRAPTAGVLALGGDAIARAYAWSSVGPAPPEPVPNHSRDGG